MLANHPPCLTVDDLQPCDVLLSIGKDDPVSQAIMKLDGAMYSHSALWVASAGPDPRNGRIIEATYPRVVETTLGDSLDTHPREYVDVFRHATSDFDPDALLASARVAVGTRYALRTLFLVTAMLASAEPQKERGTARPWLDLVNRVHQLLGGGQDSDPDRQVTCCELVTRSFLEAGAEFEVDVGPIGELDTVLLLRAIENMLERVAQEALEPLKQPLARLRRRRQGPRPASQPQDEPRKSPRAAAGQRAGAGPAERETENDDARENHRDERTGRRNENDDRPLAWPRVLGTLPRRPKGRSDRLQPPPSQAPSAQAQVVGRPAPLVRRRVGANVGEWSPDLVTPRQIAMSPNFIYRGRLVAPRP